MRPKIALLGSTAEGLMAVNRDYLNAVWHAGGVGILLPYTEDRKMIDAFASEFDGFLFCGGSDIDPAYYGEDKQSETKNICSERDAFEKAIFEKIYRNNKPILGICRGEQVINVFLGGTLYQHVTGHDQTEKYVRSDCPQPLTLVKGGMLSNILAKDQLLVNSYHHQCVKQLAKGLMADAYSEEGYIEAYYDPGHLFLLCLQWHPEIPYIENEDSQKIFRAFLEKCK